MRTFLRVAALAFMFFVFTSGLFLAGFAVQRTLPGPTAPAPASAAASPSPTAPAAGQDDFRVFWEVWGLLKSEFMNASSACASLELQSRFVRV